MQQNERAELLASLHVKGDPLVLYNAWDAGSAQAIRDAGARVIATSSWAVAAAQGYADGEAMPLAFVEQIVARITAAWTSRSAWISREATATIRTPAPPSWRA